MYLLFVFLWTVINEGVGRIEKKDFLNRTVIFLVISSFLIRVKSWVSYERKKFEDLREKNGIDGESTRLSPCAPKRLRFVFKSSLKKFAVCKKVPNHIIVPSID